MGIFDNNVENSLERMFDFDRDGKLDFCEQGLMFEFLAGEGPFAEKKVSRFDEEEDDDLFFDEDDD